MHGNGEGNEMVYSLDLDLYSERNLAVIPAAFELNSSMPSTVFEKTQCHLYIADNHS